jgi:hypothetical protein
VVEAVIREPVSPPFFPAPGKSTGKKPLDLRPRRTWQDLHAMGQVI